MASGWQTDSLRAHHDVRKHDCRARTRLREGIRNRADQDHARSEFRNTQFSLVARRTVHSLPDFEWGLDTYGNHVETTRRWRTSRATETQPNNYIGRMDS